MGSRHTLYNCRVFNFFYWMHLAKDIFKNKVLNKKYVLVPYAIAFLFVLIAFSFAIDELPLKLYRYEEYVYDPQSQMGPNPQGPTGEAIKFLILYVTSIFINLVLLGYCVFILIRNFLSVRRKTNQIEI